MVQGAPDLALTQVAIETLSTVLFVLVLRRLPDRFETPHARCGAVAATRRRRRGGRRWCSSSRWCPAVSEPRTIASDVDDRAGSARRPRPERGQRDPRRLPRLRHARARSPCSRSPRSAPSPSPAPAGGRERRDAAERGGSGAAARSCDAARDARRVGAGRCSRRAGRLALPAVRRPQPARRRFRRRPRRRRGDRAALRRRRHRRGAPAISASGRGRSSAPASLVAAIDRARRRCCSASRCSRSAGATFDLPVLGHGQGDAPRSSFDIGVYLVVVGLVLMVFEAFGDDPPPEDDGCR